MSFITFFFMLMGKINNNNKKKQLPMTKYIKLGTRQ